MRLSRPACFLALLSLAGPVLAEAQTATSAYRAQGEAAFKELRDTPPPRERARNVIIFVGDGMGVSTLTAARIYAGQAKREDGESFQTAMDGLGHTALVKTYSHDAQVADSAPTATAILAGVKTRNSMIGIGPEAQVDDCASGQTHRLPSLIELAQAQGLATGVVTTTRITHATPAAAYAHTVQRDWESAVPEKAAQQGCTDIARQLVEGGVGRRLDVIMGGGRGAFLPRDVQDPEYADQSGKRADGRNLIDQWQKAHPRGVYTWNRTQVAAYDPSSQRPLLALFEPDHMQYETDRANDRSGEPSLAEMTETAIRALSNRETGYVLLVEGGRIDHAHHAGNAHRALADAAAFDEAVTRALALVDLDETLIITTADHSHTLTISGYPVRGNPILGTVAEAPGEPRLARDGMAYTTLGYANGPGQVAGQSRSDPGKVDTASLDYLQQAAVPLSSETHGGEDVVARASGPGAQWLRGTIEQHTIFYVLREALFGSKTQAN